MGKYSILIFKNADIKDFLRKKKKRERDRGIFLLNNILEWQEFQG